MVEETPTEYAAWSADSPERSSIEVPCPSFSKPALCSTRRRRGVDNRGTPFVPTPSAVAQKAARSSRLAKRLLDRIKAAPCATARRADSARRNAPVGRSMFSCCCWSRLRPCKTRRCPPACRDGQGRVSLPCRCEALNGLSGDLSTGEGRATTDKNLHLQIYGGVPFQRERCTVSAYEIVEIVAGCGFAKVYRFSVGKSANPLIYPQSNLARRAGCWWGRW